MFTVFIVDDEPAALVYLNRLVKLINMDFRITGEFEDAQGCLKQLEIYQPDVIISDIKMPGMSGLELLKEVNARYPQIACLILSAYSEFEYAREAIRGRAYEYLLKPIVPDEFVKVMNRIRILIAGRYLKERNQLIYNMYQNEPVSEEDLRRYFESDEYYGIMMRRNGLPAEVSKGGKNTVSSGLYESIVVYGGDEDEALFLIPKECVQNDSLLRIARRLERELYTKQDKLTTIVTKESFLLQDMADKVNQLYRRLYQTLVLGKEKLTFLEDRYQPRNLSKEEKLLVNEIKELLMEKVNDAAYLKLEKLCNDFTENEMPQHVVRRTIKHIMNTMWMFAEEEMDWRESDVLLDTLFCNSLSVASLCEDLKELFPASDGGFSLNKIDTEKNYCRIRNYVLQNLKEPLSLGRIGKEFGISKAYLTRMFRKYENTSFNNFLTAARIEEAKKIILIHPDWFIRDIARAAGYQDQFYFSRVFRAYTGYSPSDYLVLNQE